MKNAPLNIGIVGVGRFGSRHLEKWLTQDNAKLIGFCDIDPDVQTSVQKNKHIPYFSLETLIAQADIIDIVVPAISHYEIAKQALEAGKHVFIEKPFTETLEQAQHLADLAKQSGCLIGIGHIERFNPVFLALKKKISAPLVSLNAYRQGPFIPGVGLDVSIVMELMIHDIDLVRQLIPLSIKNITAEGDIIHSNKIDRATAILTFENGCKVTLFASRAENSRRREIICFTNTNTYTANLMERSLLVSDSKKIVSFKEYDAMVEELHDFAEAVRSKQKHLVNEADGLASIRVAKEIEKCILYKKQ